MATVDVLVPTYNRSAMLRRCLESIQAQTYTDIRVIIGDNCSDDDTRAVAQDFSGRDGRFGYVRNAANLGSIGNMSALFTRVTAPYVHFMHDDWLELRLPVAVLSSWSLLRSLATWLAESALGSAK